MPASASPRPASKPRTAPKATTPFQALRQLVGRTLVILMLAAAVAGGATAIGYSPLASALPSTILPFAGQGHGAFTEVANAANSGQPAIGRGQQPTASGASATAVQPTAAQGLFSGRNAPNVVAGLRQELPYGLLFAGLTALAALAWRLLQPRRKRPAHRRNVFGDLLAAALHLLQPSPERTAGIASAIN